MPHQTPFIFTLLLFGACIALPAQRIEESEPEYPDPDIFDGTFADNWERDEEMPPYARIGETSYGNSLEGKENKVKGWVTEQGENPEGEGRDPQRQGKGFGDQGDPEDTGGGGNEEITTISQEEQPENPGGPGEEEGQRPESGGGPMGGSMESQGQGMSNPLAILKAITQGAQKNNQRGGTIPEEEIEESDEEGTYGNNPYQVEKMEESAEVLGSSSQEESEQSDENASRERSAASGRQERGEGGSGPDTGDDLPSGI